MYFRPSQVPLIILYRLCHPSPSSERCLSRLPLRRYSKQRALVVFSAKIVRPRYITGSRCVS
uniref:Uncharacterized protein n=1 Tax=Arundo donax TaxID=35708 RepID=A0A0A9CAB5_ARUDO